MIFYVRDLCDEWEPPPPPPPPRRTRAWTWLRMETGLYQQETLRPIDLLAVIIPSVAWIVLSRNVLGKGWSQWGLLVMIGGFVLCRKYVRSSGRRSWT